MTDHESADRAQRIVGAARNPTQHLGRAVSATQRVYILHSQTCLDERPDLRECPFSRALDAGIDPRDFIEDVAVQLEINSDGHLVSHDLSTRTPMEDRP